MKSFKCFGLDCQAPSLESAPKTINKTTESSQQVQEDKATEAIVQRCSVKKALIEISQNSQENTYARVSLLVKLQD